MHPTKHMRAECRLLRIRQSLGMSPWPLLPRSPFRALPRSPKIPILGEVLGLRQAVFLGGNPSVFACEVGGALPSTAVVAPINVDFAAKDCVLLWHSVQAAKTAKLCKLCVGIPEVSSLYPYR